MVKNVLIIVALIVFLVSLIFIYNARLIVKKKVKQENENNVVTGLKVLGYILCIVSLFLIYFLNR